MQWRPSNAIRRIIRQLIKNSTYLCSDIIAYKAQYIMGDMGLANHNSQ